MKFHALRNLKIEKKIILMFLSIAAIGLFISTIVMGYFLYQTKQKTYQEFSHSLELIMKEKHNALETVAYTNMLSIASNTHLVDALKNNDRNTAISILKDVETSLEENTKFGTFKVHLHTKEGHAFLRSWKPHKFGDDLTTFRHTIPHIVKNHQPFVTTEVGKTGMTIRGIVPMFDTLKQYVGSAEFILSFDSFVPWMKAQKGAELLVLLDKKYQIKSKESDVHVGHYVLSQKRSNPDFLQSIKTLDIDTLKSQNYFSDQKYLYKSVPIKDFAGEEIGLYLIGEPMDIVDAIVEDSYMMIYTSLFIITLLLLFSTGLSIYALRKLIFNRLKDFQSGLMNFFDYLHNKSLQVQPIKVENQDEIGTMAEIINAKITNLQKEIASEQVLMDQTTQIIENVGNGNFTHRIQGDSDNETLKKMISLLNHLFENLEKNIGKDVQKIVHVLEEYSACNYTQSIPSAYGRVELTINRMQEVITQMLVQNVQSGEKLQDSASELSQNVTDLNQSASEQFDSTEHTFLLLEKINETMQMNIQKLDSIGERIDTLTDSLQEGEKLSNETGESMDVINTRVEEILVAIAIIDEIAFQTNILSLNAAVEAATAGEAGKGFAVVAQEVRNLASKSSQAAQSIKHQVENATKMTKFGKTSSEKMLEGYMSLKNIVMETTQEIGNISTEIKAQNQHIQQVNKAMKSVRTNVQNNRTIATKMEGIATNSNVISDEIARQSKKSKYDENLVGLDACEI